MDLSEPNCRKNLSFLTVFQQFAKSITSKRGACVHVRIYKKGSIGIEFYKKVLQFKENKKSEF